LQQSAGLPHALLAERANVSARQFYRWLWEGDVPRADAAERLWDVIILMTEIVNEKEARNRTRLDRELAEMRSGPSPVERLQRQQREARERDAANAAARGELTAVERSRREVAAMGGVPVEAEEKW